MAWFPDLELVLLVVLHFGGVCVIWTMAVLQVLTYSDSLTTVRTVVLGPIMAIVPLLMIVPILAIVMYNSPVVRTR